jgi:hypothetical protein
MPPETTPPFYYLLHNRLGALRFRFDTAKVRGLINIVLPRDVPPFQVELNRAHSWSALFYSPYSSYCGWRRRDFQHPSLPLISLRVGPPFDKRRISGASPFMQARGYLRVAIRNSDEMLVLLLAHELRHLWQFANSPEAAMTFGELMSQMDKHEPQRSAKVTPEQLAAKRAAETDADRYAKTMLREYRRRIARGIPNAIAQSRVSSAASEWVQLPLEPPLSP